MCGRLVNLDTVARVIADYYHLKTETQLAVLNEALSRVPAETVGGGHESLIERQAAIDALGERPVVWTDKIYYILGARNQYDMDRLAIETVPSARQEIVACGDCKHWICHDRRCGYWNHGVKPLDWCCHAERRTDG